MLKTEVEKLKKIREVVINLGSFVTEKNEIILSALETRDVSFIQNIKLQPKRNLQASTNNLDNQIVTALSLYTPEAHDLRELVSYLKISNEIMRVCSNSRSFIKTFIDAFRVDLELSKIYDQLIPMQTLTVAALTGAIDMISLHTEQEVKNTFEKIYLDENKTDKIYQKIEKEIIALTTQQPELSLEYLEVLSAVRRIEKIADRALSIASLVYYAKIGGEISQEIEINA
ncbi:MAG: PhoU domain-containing protein [Pseudomonadota bacterium]